jgi:hypothetical protein
MDLLTHLANTSVFAVVEFAIVENEFDILHEFTYIVVALLFQFRFYRSKVHRLLHNCWVVRDVELLVIYWLGKNPC